MPPPTGQSCSNCQFFKVDKTTSPDTGQCVRYPPQVVYEAGVGAQDMRQAIVWPVTYASEWCGEWMQAK